MFRRLSFLTASISLFLAVVHGQAQTIITYDVRAYIDGRDKLIIKGNTVQWQHLDSDLVGRWNGANAPTVVSSTFNGAEQMNAVNWFPDWLNGTGSGAYSSVFSGLMPALPARDTIVMLTPIESRYSTRIDQLPSAANGYTLIIDFNDIPPSGATWYRSLITVTFMDIYVDGNYVGVEMGTPTNPFRTVTKAILAASSTLPVTVYVKGGTYPENVAVHGKRIHFVKNGGILVKVGNP